VLPEPAGRGVEVGNSEGALFAGMSVQAAASGGAKSVTERTAYRRATGNPPPSRGFKGCEPLPAWAVPGPCRSLQASGRVVAPACLWILATLHSIAAYHSASQ